MMLPICLILLWAAIFQQKGATTATGNSLLCNNATNTTVEVEAGGNVRLCCTIDTPHHKCEVKNYKLPSGKSVPIRACNCGQEEETCVFNQSKNVSVVISNVTENQNYPLTVFTTCGFELKHDIEVKVWSTPDVEGRRDLTPPVPTASLAPPLPATGIVACVLLPLLLGIIVVVIRIRKRRTSSQLSKVKNQDDEIL